MPGAGGAVRIAAVGDLHYGRTDGARLARLLETAAASADILVLCGDLTDTGLPDEAKKLARELAAAKLPTVAVLGNHDYGWDYKQMKVGDKLSAGLADLGINVLRNARCDVAGLTITGIDDFWGPNFHPEDILPKHDPAAANLVLCHNPDVADLRIWCGYKGWILSGHTHGGQCKPPYLPPPRLPVRNRRYVAGDYDLFDGRWLYINRGLGHTWPVRFNVRPEITVFTLRQEAAAV
jgi:predicted MPP superfamily phosphohydrolase